MVDRDTELVGRARRGDRNALELLFRRYVERVWRYGWFVSRSREAAADIVQETFLRVMRSIGTFEGRSSFATWLYALTRSCAMEWLRRRRLEERSQERPNVFRLVKPVEEREVDQAGESRDELRRAVAELPAAQRDAVILCELMGLSIADAAVTLGWGHSRVKVTLFRARRRLEEVLEAQMDETNGKTAEHE